MSQASNPQDPNRPNPDSPRQKPIPSQHPPVQELPAVAPARPSATPLTKAPPATSLVHRKRRRSSRKVPLALGMLALLAAAGGFAVWKFVIHKPALAIRSMPAKNVNELAELKFTVPLNMNDVSLDQLEFALDDAPPGANIDAKTGEFKWTPTEEQGPGEYKIGIRVAAQGHDDLRDKKTLVVTVKEVPTKPVILPIGNKTVKIVDGEIVVAFTIEAKDLDIPAEPLRFMVVKGPQGMKVDAQTGAFEWRSKNPQSNKDLEFTIGVAKANNKLVSSQQTFTVHIEPADRPAE